MSNPYKITFPDSENYVVTTNGVLNVCLCDKTCDHHLSLKSLLDAGYKTLLHVKNDEGNIVALTLDDLKPLP